MHILYIFSNNFFKFMDNKADGNNPIGFNF